MGKGEIAHYEQFLLSHSVFKRLVLQTHKNQGLFGKGLNRVYMEKKVKGFHTLGLQPMGKNGFLMRKMVHLF